MTPLTYHQRHGHTRTHLLSALRTTVSSRPNRRPATAGSDLLTIKELCERLKIARSTLHLWRQRGQGPLSIKLPNGDIRFRERDVEEWLNELSDTPKKR
jgi:predicted DNA-binding transcriptional regulator AlpA